MRQNYVRGGNYFMKLLKKNNLRIKLLSSYVILVLLPFLISTFVLSSTSSSNIRTNTLSYINLFVEQISSNIDSYIGELDRMTRIITLDSSMCNILTEPSGNDAVSNYLNSQHLENEILKMTTQQPSIRNVTFIGVNGMIYSGTSNSITDTDLFFDITHADDIDEQDSNIYLSSAHIPSYLLVDYHQNTEPVFTLTRPLYTYNKQKIGSVVLIITCEDLLNAININPSLLENGARIVVTNKDNKIVADTSENFVPENLSDKTYMVLDNSDQNDTKNLFFSDDSGSLTSTVIISKNQLFKSTLDFNRASIFLVLILIGLIILLSFYFSYRLVRPIKLLENAANECAQGNYSIRIPIVSQDEIGNLCLKFNFMTEQIQNLLDRVYQYQLSTKQAQLEALQNQISPHFLHNTLDIIRMKALINKDKEVAKMVETLAKLFRITLDRNSNIVTIKDELEHVETYLTIQNMRFNNRYHFVKNVPDELLKCSIIKLTLQPLVENSIKHGFSQTFDDEMIEIQIESSGHDLIIQVRDNGIGIDENNIRRIYDKLEHLDTLENNTLHNSIGIVNISDRIRLEYGSTYYLRIFPNSPRGTVVELRIPKNYNLEMIPEID